MAKKARAAKTQQASGVKIKAAAENIYDALSRGLLRPNVKRVIANDIEDAKQVITDVSRNWVDVLAPENRDRVLKLLNKRYLKDLLKAVKNSDMDTVLKKEIKQQLTSTFGTGIRARIAQVKKAIKGSSPGEGVVFSEPKGFQHKQHIGEGNVGSVNSTPESLEMLKIFREQQSAKSAQPPLLPLRPEWGKLVNDSKTYSVAERKGVQEKNEALKQSYNTNFKGMNRGQLLDLQNALMKNVERRREALTGGAKMDFDRETADVFRQLSRLIDVAPKAAPAPEVAQVVQPKVEAPSAAKQSAIQANRDMQERQARAAAIVGKDPVKNMSMQIPGEETKKEQAQVAPQSSAPDDPFADFDVDKLMADFNVVAAKPIAPAVVSPPLTPAQASKKWEAVKNASETQEPAPLTEQAKRNDNREGKRPLPPPPPKPAERLPTKKSAVIPKHITPRGGMR